jgi:hypothetical protein
LRVASVDTGFFEVLIFWLISKIVNSIPLLYQQKHTNQERNVKKSDILLYTIRTYSSFWEIFENFQNILSRTLTIHLG